MSTPNVPKRPSLLVPPDLNLTYANLARISHSPADVVIDFAHLLPGESQARVTARVLLSPLSAKLLYRALGENLARYEAAYGEIVVPTASLADQLFRRYQNPGGAEGDKDE